MLVQYISAVTWLFSPPRESAFVNHFIKLYALQKLL